jgi:mRNA-degrading endonuclease RelE of RelBE toxin-antitoxin system
MGIAVDYKKEIIKLTKELPEDKLRELIDFAQFLKVKNEGFAYIQVRDSAEYVRKLRIKEGQRVRSGKKFIEELIEWQKSNF